MGFVSGFLAGIVIQQNAEEFASMPRCSAVPWEMRPCCCLRAGHSAAVSSRQSES
jgi:hypothetical protein